MKRIWAEFVAPVLSPLRPKIALARTFQIGRRNPIVLPQAWTLVKF